MSVSLREAMEVLWKMARTNELYTFDMFYNDLLSKIPTLTD
jgi:hypothetical protein